MGPAVTARALRTLTGGKAFEDDPLLGTDPQPKHYRDRIRIPDPDVAAHLNSGIPNHAFYLVATRLGGELRGPGSLPRFAGTEFFSTQ